MKLSEMKILTLKDWDWQESSSSEEASTLPAEEEAATADSTADSATPESASADSDVLVPNPDEQDDK
jgi:hypothetical protein